MKLRNSLSLRTEYMVVIVILILGTTALSLLLNALFLERFYFLHKQRSLHKAYESLNHASADGEIVSADFDESFEEFCETNNIELLVIDTDSKVLLTTRDNPQMLTRLWANVFTPDLDPDTEVIRALETDSTHAMQLVRRRRSGLQYIEMWGDLQNGELFLVMTAVESMRNAVMIANRFTLMMGLVIAVLGLIVAGVLSRKAADPIRQLSHISEQMKDLNFDAKYVPFGRREIDELGLNMNELSEELERKISELKTVNFELQQDIKEKTAAEEMRRDFVASVSHELKTPIALIQGYAEGLREGINEDAESRAYYCEVIEDEAGRLNRMVKQILTLSQLESGAEPMTFERFDLVEMLQNFIKSADILTKSVSARVLMEDYAKTYVWADTFAVEEVIQNYFQNAIHHVDGERVIEIKIEDTVSEDGKARVKTTVFNTGDPIPEESLPRLWDQFYKVDKSRTREYGGSGVGLSIVKAILDAMQCHYGVTNYDNGVAFWFDLEKA